jgi:hypothetical protein
MERRLIVERVRILKQGVMAYVKILSAHTVERQNKPLSLESVIRLRFETDAFQIKITEVENLM